MKQKKRTKKQILEDELKWLDPEQEMVLEQDDEDFRAKPSTLRETLSRGFRSMLAVVLCVVIPALWYFDWNPSAFADETSGFVTGLFEEMPAAPAVPLPPAPNVLSGSSELDMSMVDYTSTLNEQGLLETFSSPAVTAFYENGVTVDYLLRLRDAGLIEDFSFPAVVAFFQNQTSLDYLSVLKTENLLSELSFPAVIAFHQNEVSIDYLNRLREAELLSDTSFPAVVAYYTNNVTIEFLTELKERELLENLSFPDVVNMYQNN